jgi:ammonia channel protein AmtB
MTSNEGDKMDTDIGALTIIFTEFYYWLTIVLMFLIHIGFCMYEVGASRQKNMMHTLMKNTMLIPLVTITFFFFGWWIYFAFPNGPFIFEGKGLVAAPTAVPWSELMGPHLGGPPASDAVTADDTAFWARINGVFWGAFLLFSWTAASIVSGAVIERIRSAAFWILAVMVGSVTWIIDAAWGWHWDGWMVKLLGYHDAYASGVIHAIAGGAALGVLVHLGPRIGKFRVDGTPRNIVPRNPWLVTIGLFLIYTGFWGFYVACNVPIIGAGDIGSQGTMFTATTIYLTPTTLSAITVNFLMSLSGGLLAGYIVSKGDAFWTYSSGLAGIIAASRAMPSGPTPAAWPASSRPRRATTCTTRSRRCSSPSSASCSCTSCTTGSSAASRSTTRSARSRCTVTPAASACSSPASCFGAILRPVSKAMLPSRRGASSSVPSSCSGCSGSCRPGSWRVSSRKWTS